MKKTTILLLTYGAGNNDLIKYRKILNRYFKSINIIQYDNSYNNPIHGSNFFSNSYFEFSGYLYLLKEYEKVKKEGEMVILINDTLFRNHFFYYWLLSFKSVIKSNQNKIFIDARKLIKYNYFATWFIMFDQQDLKMIIEMLIKSISKRELISDNNFKADTIENYCIDLDQDFRKMINQWMFARGVFGWQYATEFDKMPIEERVRKGSSIFLEHTWSQLILKAGNCVDIKVVSLFARLANIIDRILNKYKRIKYLIGL